MVILLVVCVLLLLSTYFFFSFAAEIFLFIKLVICNKKKYDDG